MGNQLRGLIVEDHPVVVSSLAPSLTSLDILHLVDHERTLGAALERLQSGTHYDLVILDLNLSDAKGPDTVVRFREAYPDVPVVIFSADESEQMMATAFEHGVHGYIPKSSGMSEIREVITEVLSGRVHLPDKLARSLGVTAPRLESHEVAGRSPVVNLSPRQSEVFESLLQGLPNKVIAARLGMAEGTVKTHLNTIYRMFGVNSRVKLIMRAMALGLMDRSDRSSNGPSPRN